MAIQNGALYAWGSNEDGELGNGTTNESNVPVAVTGMDNGVTAVTAGQYYTLAIKNGTLYGWGLNYVGELGDGTFTDRHTL